jgi:hypothetical protein
LDRTDGLRITFENGEIVHLRPSGNAPELRCYTEAASEARAQELNVRCLERLRTGIEELREGSSWPGQRGRAVTKSEIRSSKFETNPNTEG